MKFISVEFYMRLIGMVVFGALGWNLGYAIGDTRGPDFIRGVILLTLTGVLFGLIFTPYFTTRPYRALRYSIRRVPANQIFAATIGLVSGLIVAALVALPVSLLPAPFGQVLPFVFAVLFAYLGVQIMIMREREVFDVARTRLPLVPGPGVAPNQALAAEAQPKRERLLVDTSAIIDGRIADVARTGFIRGDLIVPRFVLNELQRIADSSDLLRRNRGRRGLDLLSRMQKDHGAPVEIVDDDPGDSREVDAKLVVLAREWRCPIITNDYNLNKVAELQGVPVLNINELANAVKAVLLPGEDLVVKIVQEGKEFGQGVGYLDDGTMIVVEGGRRYLHGQVNIVVTRVLQTVAGRMIFGQPKENHHHSE